MMNKQSVLWMGELDTYMNEEFIIDAFGRVGERVTDIRIIRNKQTGLPAGYCFVDFGDSSDVDKIMKQHNGKPIPGTNPSRLFKLNYASGNAPEFSIYVGDLSTDVTDGMLLEFFQERYPSCRAARVVQDSQGRSRMYGFVRFTNESEQRNALVQMETASGLGSRAIKVRTAVPKKQLNGGCSPPSTSQQIQQVQPQTPQSSSTTATATTPAAAAPVIQYYYPAQGFYYQSAMQTATWAIDPYSLTATAYVQPQYYYPPTTSYAPIAQAMPAEAAAAFSASNSIYEAAHRFDPRNPLEIEARNMEYLRGEENLFLEREHSRWALISPSVPQIS